MIRLRRLVTYDRRVPTVGVACNSGQLLQRQRAQRWDRDAHPKDTISEPHDDAIVREAVDGVNQVGLPAEWVGAAGSDADRQSQFDRAHRCWSTSAIEVSCHRSGQEDGGRANQWSEDDLEVIVLQREGGFSGCGQRSEPQARYGLRLATGWERPATADPR